MFRTLTSLALPLTVIPLAVISLTHALAQNKPPSTEPKTLDIYWVDTEGDAATLIVTGSGQSLLIDSGSSALDDHGASRDANRIFKVASEEAGLKKIDYLLTTHFAPDHAGGVAALAKLIPIDHFLDHGDAIDANTPEGAPLFNEYKKTAGTKRRILKAGDRIPVTGADVIVVASDGAVIEAPLEGAASNPLCSKEKTKPADKTEDGRSVGIYLRYNKFRYLNLSDLPWERELALACPVNNLGTVNLYDASAHGFDKGNSGAPAFLYAIDPQVVVINNAEHKGLSAAAWDEIHAAPHVQGVWQEHVSLDRPNELTKYNTRGVMIANTSATIHGFWLKASVSPASNLTVTNSRNGYTEVYAPR